MRSSLSRRRTLLVSIGLAALACSAPPGPGNVPGRDGGLVRLATWNVHDLFDAEDRTTPPGDEDLVPTAAEVEAKLARIGRVLSRIDADVVVLQEVENLALLDRLAEGALAGRGYRAFLREGYDPRGIDVGVLSRLPFEVGPSHLDDRAPDGRRLWSRDVPEIHLWPGMRPLTLLGAHLVSRLDPAEDGRRIQQASRLRDIARALADGGAAGVVVLGDLNDLPGSPALAPLLGQRGCADPGASLPAAEAWTWSGAGSHQRIDYALLCEATGAVVTRIDVTAGEDVAAASDHRPVVVDVWLGPATR